MLKNEEFNISALAAKHNFKRFIYYRVTLRDKIKYDIELIDCYVNCFEENKFNHIIYACETKLRNDQSVPPNYNVNFVSYNFEQRKYTYETSNIDVLVECSDREFKLICNDLEKNEGKKSEDVLHKALEYFAYKYNLAVSGNDFIETANLCVGNFECFSFYRDKKTGNYKSASALIAPSTSIIKCNNNDNLIFQNIINNDIPVWIHFFNKSKYFYNIYNNLECVMNAAISIEAYIIYLIKNANQYDDYKKKCANYLGYKMALQYAKDNELISTEIANNFENAYEKICVQRSLIVHGAIDSPLIDRERAKIAYETILEVFDPIEKDFWNKNGLNMQEKYFEEEYNKMNNIKKNIDNGEYEKAIKELENNINNNIFKDLSIFMRAKCFSKIGKIDESIADYNKCVSNRYRLIESYNLLGIELGKKQMHEEAKNIYLEAIKLDPSYAEFYYNIGIEYQALLQYDEAILNYNKAIEIKKCSCYYYNLGTVYYYKKNYEKTLENYDKAIELESRNSKYLYERAFLYEMLKKPEEAEKDILDCLENRKDEPHIAFIKERLYQIGCLYQNLQMWEDAIRVFSKGCEIDLSNMYFYQARGNCYREIKNYENAQSDYEKCLKIDSSNESNFTNMIYLLIQMNNFKEAKKFIDKYIKICKNSKEMNNCLDIYDFNRYQEGLINYDEFIKLFYQRNDIAEIEETELYIKLKEKIGSNKTNEFLKKKQS